MTQQTKLKYIKKAIEVQLIKKEIQVTISKGELNALIAEALSNPDTAIAMKRVITPLLADSFPQFAGFTSVSIGETLEDGSTVITLRIPRERTTTSTTDTEEENTSPIQSIEPIIIVTE